MQLGNRASNVVLAVLTLVLAGVVGLAIPLIVGRSNANGMPPPHARNGATNLPTATAEPQTSTAASTATRPPSLTPALPERIALNTIEAIDLVSPTTPPRQPTASRTSTATAVPMEAIASATSTAIPTPTPSPMSGANPTTVAAGQAAKAEVAVERLNLRAGPGQNYGVVEVAKAGSAFTVTARNADNAWLQVCCVNESPAWLATEFVTVTGTIKLVPVAP